MRGVLEPGLKDVGVAAKARLAAARVVNKLYSISLVFFRYCL